MPPKAPLQTRGLSSSSYHQLLPIILYHVDGLPHLICGPVSILFSRPAAQLTGLPERLLQGFLVVFTAYGVAVVLGLRGIDKAITRHDSNSNDNDKKDPQTPQVPRWLSALAIIVNSAFVMSISASLVYFEQDLTAVGRWVLRALLGTGLVVSLGITWAVREHYRRDDYGVVDWGKKRQD